MAPLGTVLDALKAISEPTRLRIVALLDHGELTVTDLTEILGQTQPRVSRHLKLLVDAGVVTKHREGTWAFFRLVEAGPVGELARGAIDPLDDHDPVLAADLARLATVGRRGAPGGAPDLAQLAPRWAGARAHHGERPSSAVGLVLAAVVVLGIVGVLAS